MTLEAVSQYFQQKLNEPSLQYLRNKRGVDNSLIKDFGLGYCPFDIGELINLIGQEELVKAGVIFETDDGEVCSLIRNSITFPFVNQYNKIVSISFRPMQSNEVIKSKNLHKYWHVSFEKGLFLYGLNKSLPFIRETGTAIVVEGQFDAIVSHQFGFNNTIGAVGSALSPQQIKILSRFAKNFIICFDGDEAGRNASQKIKSKGAKGVNIMIANLPDGNDVDSFLRSQGPEAYKELLLEAA